MFKIFNKKRKEFAFGSNEVTFFKTLITNLPLKYAYLDPQINSNFILGFKPNALGYKDSYTFLLNGKIENNYINNTLPHYFILKNIKVWNKKHNAFYSIELDILHGVLGGFESEIIEFESFDLNKFDTFHVSEKHFVNKDLESLLTKFSNKEKEIFGQKVNDTYSINLPEGNFFYIDNIGNGDVLAIDNKCNAFILRHDPYEIKKIFSREDFFNLLENGTLINEALAKYNL